MKKINNKIFSKKKEKIEFYFLSNFFWISLFFVFFASKQKKEEENTDTLKIEVLPLPASSKKSFQDGVSRPHVFFDKNWYNWCPSVIQTEDGKYHLFHVRWPVLEKYKNYKDNTKGFLGWLPYSQIVHKIGDKPEGPFTFQRVAIKDIEKNREKWFSVHNSKIKQFGRKYYLYFISTWGKQFTPENIEKNRLKAVEREYSGPLWKELRANMRTFAAVSDSINGPWEITKEPIIEPSFPIKTLTVNPAIASSGKGSYTMIVKGDNAKMKKGELAHAVAIGKTPLGPWEIQKDLALERDYVTEDMSMWYDKKRKRFYGIYHANSRHSRYIGLITSKNGIHWKDACQKKIMKKKEILFDDGTSIKIQGLQRLQRPFVLVDKDGIPKMLYTTYFNHGGKIPSAIVAFKLQINERK